jgi:transcriptional regulator with XRE-family HTH domain
MRPKDTIMEFSEKLQEFRKQHGLTQEELADRLYVSRTAISKWESGRGYPNIESLKAISVFFSVPVDELLSGKELIHVAEGDSKEKTEHMRGLVFGLLDCAMIMFLVLPLFGQREGEVIRQISLISLMEGQWFTKAAYLAVVLISVVWGIGALALQNYSNTIWMKFKFRVSMFLNIFGVLIFMASMQPYAAFFTFVFLIIKGALLIKRQ